MRLALSTLAMLTGCTGGVQTKEPAKRPQLSETFEIRAGEYKCFYAKLTGGGGVTLDTRVPSGDAISVYVTDADNRKLFEAGKEFRYMTALSGTGVLEFSRTGTLKAGTWFITVYAPAKDTNELPIGTLIDLFAGNVGGLLREAAKSKPDVQKSRIQMKLTIGG